MGMSAAAAGGEADEQPFRVHREPEELLHGPRRVDQRYIEVARDHGAQEAIAYPLLTTAIRAGCRLAIELSKRI